MDSRIPISILCSALLVPLQVISVSKQSTHRFQHHLQRRHPLGGGTVGNSARSLRGGPRLASRSGTSATVAALIAVD